MGMDFTDKEIENQLLKYDLQSNMFFLTYFYYYNYQTNNIYKMQYFALQNISTYYIMCVYAKYHNRKCKRRFNVIKEDSLNTHFKQVNFIAKLVHRLMCGYTFNLTESERTEEKEISKLQYSQIEYHTVPYNYAKIIGFWIKEFSEGNDFSSNYNLIEQELVYMAKMLTCFKDISFGKKSLYDINTQDGNKSIKNIALDLGITSFEYQFTNDSNILQFNSNENLEQITDKYDNFLYIEFYDEIYPLHIFNLRSIYKSFMYVIQKKLESQNEAEIKIGRVFEKVVGNILKQSRVSQYYDILVNVMIHKEKGIECDVVCISKTKDCAIIIECKHLMYRETYRNYNTMNFKISGNNNGEITKRTEGSERNKYIRNHLETKYNLKNNAKVINGWVVNERISAGDNLPELLRVNNMFYLTIYELVEFYCEAQGKIYIDLIELIEYITVHQSPIRDIYGEKAFHNMKCTPNVTIVD